MVISHNSHIYDKEVRLQRNIRILGLPEHEEGRNPATLVEHWLLEKFKKKNFTPFFDVE